MDLGFGWMLMVRWPRSDKMPPCRQFRQNWRSCRNIRQWLLGAWKSRTTQRITRHPFCRSLPPLLWAGDALWVTCMVIFGIYGRHASSWSARFCTRSYQHYPFSIRLHYFRWDNSHGNAEQSGTQIARFYHFVGTVMRNSNICSCCMYNYQQPDPSPCRDHSLRDDTRDHVSMDKQILGCRRD